MATLNAQEREQLAQELANMSFNRAGGHLRRLDPTNRLEYFRNAQSATTLQTRYALPGKGVRVSLIETMDDKEDKRVAGRLRPKFTLARVEIEPLSE